MAQHQAARRRVNAPGPATGKKVLMHTEPTGALPERVYRILSAEPAPRSSLDALGALHARPYVPDDGQLTPFELDLRSWGLTVGIAYGIARGEDPYESDEDVARRALEAARAAYDRWGPFSVAYGADRAARPVPADYEERTER